MVNFVKVLRKQNWKKRVGLTVDEDRTCLYSSTEMLPEEIQDFTCPMVVMGVTWSGYTLIWT